ncbi:MAG: HAMP domain-containing histidine kinase [Proteobacteria bacterium]|nr:HAMP domain-containing histidine kinase [Pseudomonadota bacterium]
MSPASDGLLTSAQFVRLRWVVIAAAVLVAAGAMSHAPAPTLAGVAGAGLVTNALLEWVIRRQGGLTDTQLGAIHILDLLLLTAALAVTGGDASPFVLVYVVPVITASLAARVRWAMAVFTFASLCYASLFWIAPADLHAHDHNAMRSHLYGMFAAFAGVGIAVVGAGARVRASKIEADRHLAEARDIEDRNRRLGSLATLAAGAAHELATPLSTIMLVARELETAASSDHEREDLVLIREEVVRCQDVLSQLAGDAALHTAEGFKEVDLCPLLVELGHRSDERVVVECDHVVARVPVRVFEQVVRRLVFNALHASEGPVIVAAQVEGDHLLVRVTDRGEGIPEAVLHRVGEPFFTTKPDGRGLGVYYARSVSEQLGGSLKLHSTPGEGTTATLRWPMDVT